jgi:hypothetical protein
MVTLQLQHSDLTPPKIAAAGELTRCELAALQAPGAWASCMPFSTAGKPWFVMVMMRLSLEYCDEYMYTGLVGVLMALNGSKSCF